MRSLPLLLLIALFAVTAVCAQEVPRVQYDDPVAGFSITIPEDWSMATTSAGSTEIAIDAATGATLAMQPALWFFDAPKPPQQQAEALAKALTLIGGGAKPLVSPGNKEGEWVVRMKSQGVRGPLTECWLCRRERNRNYVIGVFARPETAGGFQEDVETALQSCHLIPTVSQAYLREPSENAYRLTLPSNWKWEGEIYRDQSIPGYFVWKASDPRGGAGAFSARPAAFNIQVPYTPAGQAAETMVLPYLRQEMPDLQLDQVHPLPRMGATAVAMIRGAGLGRNPRIDVVFADYVGTRNGIPIRLRLTLATWMLDQSAILGGRGNWFLNASGAWGPVNDFARQYAIGRGVIASLKTNPKWRAAQTNAVNSVLNRRNDAMDRSFKDWDAFVRDSEPISDPKTGERKEVPIGDGDAWIDPLTGKAHRVNPGDEQGAKDKNWERVPR